ncbi:MAG TPA: transglycosylase SLT domain-containing protein [Edaphobacter sp.]|nr:transglycosylase SLT domain-containing protein [Edaphobacter sp.]
MKFRFRFHIAVLIGSLLAGSSLAEVREPAATSQKPSHTAKNSLKKGSRAKSSTSKTRAGSKASSLKKSKAATRKKASSRRRLSKREAAESVHLTTAFHATEQLRPMAQQLIATRSAAAYAGVQAYARAHSGEPAAAAWLSLGHAYMLDHRYNEAYSAFQQAKAGGKALDDYADYLGAQAALQANRGADAYALLDHFAERHPASIFVANAPVLLANAYLQQNNPQGALASLQPLQDTQVGGHSDFRYMLARAYQLSGDTGHAAPIYRSIYTRFPTSFDASQARSQLDAMGMPLTSSERKTHADFLFNAKRYSDAGQEYHEIAKGDSSLSQADRDALAIYAAVCDYKLKRISRRDVERLPETGNDDTAAAKLYLLAEISRNENDQQTHTAILDQLIKRFPTSRWLEEALYSGGNMYLIKRDYEQAIRHYGLLVQMFPRSTYAPSAHWRCAWLNYRVRRYGEAARLMDEQIVRYAAGIEAPTALYWRARIYEDEEHNPGQAANYYRSLVSNYVNYYYAELARKRLAVLGKVISVPDSPVLASVQQREIPSLTDDLPEDEPHLIKARLLANAALNEYIAPEIQAAPDSAEWGALAEARIYASYGETTRALQSLKRSKISFFALPMDQVPDLYWQLLFPRPYWSDLVTNAEKNGLDPFLVASLIRQESEFNAGAVSRAHAYGLMQLLPSVGKSLARKQHMRSFSTAQLLNPSVNLQLGTLNLSEVLSRYGGQPEYALAAYNAGDVPVRQWMAAGDYKDIAEFVESIPYTETREYVQSILRNRMFYQALYGKKL